MLRVYLFRDFAATYNGEALPGLEARKARELFSYLLLNQERPHRRHKLMTLLWEDSDETKAQKYLRQTLWQLQSGLEPYFPDEDRRPLLVDVDWVQIDRSAEVWCDAVEFHKAYRSSQGTSGNMLNSAQARTLQEAIALYQGDLLEGWYHYWCQIEREDLLNQYLMMLEKLMDYCEVNGRYEDGIAHGMLALKQDFARERTYRRLMRLFSQLGDRNGALRQYERCVAALRSELDVAPSERTQRLYALIRGDEWVRAPSVPVSQAVASTSLLSDLHNHLTHLHSTLGEMQTVMRHDIAAISRSLPRRR